MVTGGDEGLGYEIAVQLLKYNAQVIITSAHSDRGQAAVNYLRQLTGKTNVSFLPLDLSDIVRTRLGTAGFLDLGVSLNGLIITDEYDQEIRLTSSGYDKHLQVNLLGTNYLLSQLYKKMLESNSPARVIFFYSSKDHDPSRLGAEIKKYTNTDLNEMLEQSRVDQHDLFDRSKVLCLANVVNWNEKTHPHGSLSNRLQIFAMKRNLPATNTTKPETATTVEGEGDFKFCAKTVARILSDNELVDGGIIKKGNYIPFTEKSIAKCQSVHEWTNAVSTEKFMDAFRLAESLNRNA